MSEWTLRPSAVPSGHTIEWLGPREALMSRGCDLYRACKPEAPLERIGSVTGPSWRTLAARSRLAARLLRLSFYNVIPLPDGRVFLSFGRQIGILRDGRLESLQGVPRSCRILRSACAVEFDGSLLYGEYFANRDRLGAVHILRLPPGSAEVEVAHRFERGTVRHVHGVFRDEYDGCLWCLTGDVGEECRIIRSSDGFETLDVIGSGDESWRSVSLLFTADAIFYGTDAEAERNFIYRIDRRTMQRDRLVEVDGPIYYSHAVGGDLFFGVTAELCPSQKGRSAWLWHASPDGQCQPVASYEKDRWSPRYFLPGAFYFPSGPGYPASSYVNTVALAGVDGTAFELVRKE